MPKKNYFFFQKISTMMNYEINDILLITVIPLLGQGQHKNEVRKNQPSNLKSNKSDPEI